MTVMNRNNAKDENTNGIAVETTDRRHEPKELHLEMIGYHEGRHNNQETCERQRLGGILTGVGLVVTSLGCDQRKKLMAEFERGKGKETTGVGD